MTIPPQMKILHHREYSEQERLGYREEIYFRLYHPLETVDFDNPAGYGVRTAEKSDISLIVEIINASYGDISVTEGQMQALTDTAVYAPELWILAEDRSTGSCVGCAIADLDREAGEGILEWVQVLPEYRRKGIGRLLVKELLRRMKGKAEFATVSGKDVGAERLYQSCGFRGNDLWHIMWKE